jgi:hypothetical protein
VDDATATVDEGIQRLQDAVDFTAEAFGIDKTSAARAIAAIIDPENAPAEEPSPGTTAMVEGDGSGETLAPIEETETPSPTAAQQIAAQVAESVGTASITPKLVRLSGDTKVDSAAITNAVEQGLINAANSIYVSGDPASEVSESVTTVFTVEETTEVVVEEDDSDDGREEHMAVEIDPKNPGRFRALLVREGERTADDRIVEVGATEWRPPPLPLMLQTRTDVGHMGAEIAAVIETIHRDGNDIIGEGRYDTSTVGIEAARLAANKVMRGISVDPGDVEFDVEIEEMDDDGFPTKVLARFTHMTILGATQTPFQAIGSSQIEWIAPITNEEAEAIAASAEFTATRFSDLSLTDRERPWSGSDAKARLREWASSDGSGDVDKIDFTKFRRGFFWYDPDNAESVGAYKLPFADIVNGQIQAVWRGVTASAAAVQGARGGVDIPSTDRASVQSHISRYYAKARGKFGDDSIKPPWEMSAHEVVEMATAMTASAPRTFPVSWFQPPEFSGPVPLTVEPVRENGEEIGCRVYGHLALWNQCHTGYQGVCEMAPHSQHDYAYFLTGAVHLDDGTQARVGPITLGTEHPDLKMNPYAAKAHYDDTGRVAAWVTVGEDEHGIWCTGTLRPDLDPDQAASFAAAAPSGDWRWLNGSLEMIAVLAVNTPGFPIARFEDDHQVALVASGYAPQRDRGRRVLGKEIDGLRLTTQEMLNRVLEGIADLKSSVSTQGQRLDAIDEAVQPVLSARNEERLAAVRERLGI